MPPMTEPEATPRRAALPHDPDELADLIAEARSRILQLQNLIRIFGRAEQRIRNHGADPRGTLADPGGPPSRCSRWPS
jgi:hypothetical protein